MNKHFNDLSYTLDGTYYQEIFTLLEVGNNVLAKSHMPFLLHLQHTYVTVTKHVLWAVQISR